MKRNYFTGGANWLDKLVTYISPVQGLRRQFIRNQLSKSGGYSGAKATRTSLKEWKQSMSDADGATLPDLPALRHRSRDLVRNNAIAAGCINPMVTNVVGSGLQFRSHIDAKFLGMTAEEGDEWEVNTEREFRLWAESAYSDITGDQDFYGLQALAFRSYLESGDVFALLPSIERNNFPYSLSVQLIEADRVSNAKNVPDDETLAGGIERDDTGRPIRYHIQRKHPGARQFGQKQIWDIRAAFGANGRRRVVHLKDKRRIGQSRGVPTLAPIIETLKQIGEYTQAELDAALVSALFAVFIKSEDGAGIAPLVPGSNDQETETDVKLGSGIIANLAKGESIETANPGRPNSEFGRFTEAMFRQIGMALEIPYEVLIKHFASSYSASRGAVNEAWRFYKMKRAWFAKNFCQIIFEEWLYEAVTLERVYAPGFLEDPAIRKAYSHSSWSGPAKGQIDEGKEATAAEKRISIGLTTLETETAELTGGNWEDNHIQRTREKKKRVDDGLEEPVQGVEPDLNPEEDDNK